MKRSYKMLFVLIGAMCLACFSPVAAFATSSNPYAGSLTKTTGTLSPHFSKAHYSYSLVTSASTEYVTVFVTPENSHAKCYMRVTGGSYHQQGGFLITIASGHSTYLHIKIVAEDGHSTRTYVIQVTRNSYPTSFRRIGSSYAGGKIVYLDSTGQHGLVVANTNQGTSATWSSAKIKCANLVSGGHSDWRLPSPGELNQVYINKGAIGGFTSGSYWGSSFTTTMAWCQSFSNGGPSYDYLTAHHAVRAVRSF